MKSYTSHDLLRVVKNDGWVINLIVDSHCQLVHPTKDLAIGTVKRVIRQEDSSEGDLR